MILTMRIVINKLYMYIHIIKEWNNERSKIFSAVGLMLVLVLVAACGVMVLIIQVINLHLRWCRN